MVVTRPATREDAASISALLTANDAAHGGALLGDWSLDKVTQWLASGSLVIVATSGDSLAGVLFTEDKARAAAPPVKAMLAAWPGGPDAYVYGPVCIDAGYRGAGVLDVRYGALVARRRGREAILFIRASNEASLRAHRRLGMREVARFALGGEEFLVLSDGG